MSLDIPMFTVKKNESVESDKIDSDVPYSKRNKKLKSRFRKWQKAFFSVTDKWL